LLQGRGTPRDGRRLPADESGNAARRAGGIARVHALGREGEVEVRAGTQATSLDGLAERAHGGAGEGRRLEHDELPRSDVIADVAGRRQDRSEIRILGRRDGGRHADEDGVGGLQRRIRMAGDAQGRSEGRGQPLIGDVVDRGVAGLDGRHPRRGDVDALDVETRLGEGDGEGQADVSEADDGHAWIRGHGGSIVEGASPVAGSTQATSPQRRVTLPPP
jgi:hypothetical protein